MSEEKKKKERWVVAHIYSSFNNTILTITDITGAEVLTRASGGQVVRADRLEGSPAAAVLLTKKALEDLRNYDVTGIHIKIRAVGGHEGPWFPGPGGRAALKALLRSGYKIGFLEDVTPIPHDRCRRAGGRRGRRM